jgi:hypothetical protein
MWHNAIVMMAGQAASDAGPAAMPAQVQALLLAPGKFIAHIIFFDCRHALTNFTCHRFADCCDVAAIGECAVPASCQSAPFATGVRPGNYLCGKLQIGTVSADRLTGPKNGHLKQE